MAKKTNAKAVDTTVKVGKGISVDPMELSRIVETLTLEVKRLREEVKDLRDRPGVGGSAV